MSVGIENVPCLLAEKGNPAKVQNGKTNHETEYSHHLQLHVHDILVLRIQLKHFRLCHIARFNIREIDILLLLGQKGCRVACGNGPDGERGPCYKGIGRDKQ